MVVGLLGALALGLDQATKYLAFSSVSGGEMWPIVGRYVGIRLARNTGGAFGIFRNLPYNNVLLVVTSSATLVLLFVLMRRYTKGRLAGRIGLALVTAGALSNLLDRLIFGYVRDFIYCSFWPTFNVADVAICVGIGLLALELLREGRRHPVAVGADKPPASTSANEREGPVVPRDTNIVPPK